MTPSSQREAQSLLHEAFFGWPGGIAYILFFMVVAAFFLGGVTALVEGRGAWAFAMGFFTMFSVTGMIVLRRATKKRHGKEVHHD